MRYKIYREPFSKIGLDEKRNIDEIAIFPNDSTWEDGDFIWQICTVDISASGGVHLPISSDVAIDRHIGLINGDVILMWMGQKVVRLGSDEIHLIPKGEDVKVMGEGKIYVLTKRASAKGTVEVGSASEDNQTVDLDRDEGMERMSWGAYCHDGYVVVEAGKYTEMLSPGQQIVVDLLESDRDKISYMGEGKVILTKIKYGKDEIGPRCVPAERVSFEDYRQVLKIANSNFRGSSIIFKSLRENWYDEELQEGISKLEKAYIPFWICLLGVTLTAALAFKTVGIDSVVPLVLTWLVLDVFIVTPLLYLLVLPKPVKGHIIPLDEMTPYEKRVYGKEMEGNKRAETILKKYKKSGRNLHED